MGPRSLRIYLTGRVCFEADEALIDQSAFPSQQARLAFAFLVSERNRAVTRSELAEVLWPRRLPPSWDTSLSVIISKIRSLLIGAGLEGSRTLTGALGCYELRLPQRSWVDLEAAADSIHQAEAALKAGSHASAYGPSAVAHHIARRPFLPGEEGEWVERRRDKQRNILIRALECRAEVYMWNNEHSLAVEAARDAISLEPFRETCYQLLMRAHDRAGNAAEALRVYEECRKLISEELGVHPSRQTREVYKQVLQSI